MLRKLLVAAVAIGVMGVAVPQSADATTNAGVLVFTGSAKVGNQAWTDVNLATAPGEGLCFPGLTATSESKCAVTGALTDVTNGWSFKVPDPAAEIPSQCVASGVFNGVPVAGDTNCILDTNGLVVANTAGVGPSCGMSHGDSALASPNLDALNPGSAHKDTVTVNGTVADIEIQWTTSAGGSLPLTGTVKYRLANGASHDHPVAGYVQTRPVQGGNCATAPAEDFVVAGVVATQ